MAHLLKEALMAHHYHLLWLPLDITWAKETLILSLPLSSWSKSLLELTGSVEFSWAVSQMKGCLQLPNAAFAWTQHVHGALRESSSENLMGTH